MAAKRPLTPIQGRKASIQEAKSKLAELFAEFKKEMGSEIKEAVGALATQIDKNTNRMLDQIKDLNVRTTKVQTVVKGMEEKTKRVNEEVKGLKKDQEN